MNSKIYKLSALFFFLTIASFYFSCKKDDKKDDTTPITTTSTDKDASVAEDNETAESEFEEVFNYVDEESNTNDNLRTTGGDIDTFFVNPTRYACVDTVRFKRSGSLLNPPIKKEIRFIFDSSKTCNNGSRRMGKIVAKMEGAYKKLGTVVTITFEDFYVQRPNMTKWIHIQGTKTITMKAATTTSRTINVK